MKDLHVHVFKSVAYEQACNTEDVFEDSSPLSVLHSARCRYYRLFALAHHMMSGAAVLYMPYITVSVTDITVMLHRALHS